MTRNRSGGSDQDGTDLASVRNSIAAANLSGNTSECRISLVSVVWSAG